MSFSLNGFYGRKTWAMLDSCAKCRKPYQSGVWHTYECKDGKSTVYWILCGDCHEKNEKVDA